MSDGNDARPDARDGHDPGSDARDGHDPGSHARDGHDPGAGPFDGHDPGSDAGDGDDAGPDARDGHGAPAGPAKREQQKHPHDTHDMHDMHDTHAGKGTVNHGPAAQGPDAPGADGPATDEAALRAMMQRAVREMEPSDGTLEHLRRAVPARRARKRQALVGAAAAALFLGTAVPALVHVSNATGAGADPSVAGNASQAQGGASQGKDPAGGQSGVAGTGDTPEDRDKADPKETPGGKEPGAATGAPPSGVPSASSPADVPACAPGSLGPAVASSAEPDSTGVVYGSFRVTNVSSDGCTVTGPGTVVTASLGAAEATRIGTARHAAGDAAAGLPDPSLETASLALAPGAAYEVQFAWVPSETCPTTGGTTGGGSGGPSPDPSPTADTTAAGGTSAGGGEAGPTTQLITEDGPAEGSVSVTYTPEGGSGSATATVSNACAGTVYWTGLLADSGSGA
ncbi:MULTISPECIES: hypothetical protein [Streptomyces]|uniref:DUF4232 domain-containing protein n=1 Tax=Streptomyces anthocyanicus TaxID=68174 RepID=A0ABZ1LXH6_9ACTN|nr:MULTISPECIES: hypothetical protein [unclassified Streptomyces]REH21856.1 hypothetical protein BX268_3700 [Streptomyces sp. 2221.1]SDT60624.1 hypothetical protein SAMN05428941_3690 [Streptomyces sp. 2114.2]